MRVLLVDDEPPCLEELVYLLSKQENIKIIGAFTSPVKALKASADLKPEIAFLDLSMPHMSGPELARELLVCSPDLKIVFITAYRKELEKIRDSPAVESILKPVNDAKLQDLFRRLSVFLDI